MSEAQILKPRRYEKVRNRLYIISGLQYVTCVFTTVARAQVFSAKYGN
jgi:hypothetical protein